ncbi:MAG: ABC transporter ATP-binding protein [Desulfobacterales bacterium]|jgi:ABC-2 type transport system ATP-binding protein|nr:ABC transporter ATP-binding protein [Desulfobacteraceae bacterium]MBT4363681.1 ABC transporter ATP-binding protein [Desulfobacteraceae bacterium]MBT7087233.1 ABC transporter ATP-binding protein [Desulfobacterales bacterium]
MDPAVLVSQVYKRYGNLEALYGIDFSIAKGSFFGLLGPNGAGKSTLINIMAGLVHATSGNIKVVGYDVRKQWRKSRQILGVVPQELAYDPFFSTREMLRLQSGYFGLGKDNYVWVDELLERLGLGDKADENLGNLSGGMKRRVLIAQALVHKPEVLVLDEPTAGVDVELRRVLWEFVRELHKNGHTILLTTHYIEEAESFCDRIAILDNGRLIAHDTTNALLNRYPYRFLRLSVKNYSTQIPEKLLEKVVLNENNELTFRLHREDDNIGDVLDAVQNAGISFTDLRTDEPGLEEVFLALTVKNHD